MSPHDTWGAGGGAEHRARGAAATPLAPPMQLHITVRLSFILLSFHSIAEARCYLVTSFFNLSVEWNPLEC